MLRNAVVILGVGLFTVCLLVAATLRVNGGFESVAELSATSVSSNVKEYAGLAREAYLYAQPLLASYQTLYQDMRGEVDKEPIGAFNTLKVATRVNGSADQRVTLKAWLDLRSEPMLLHVPRDGGALGAIEVRDLYGDLALAIEPLDRDANYLMVAQDWEVEVPPGIHKVLPLNTDLASVHTTTRVGSAATYEHLRAWAGTVALVPLSAYMLEDPPPLAPDLKLPEWKSRLATTPGFIPYLNFMLRFLHPDAVEEEQLRRFERIGIVAGLPRAPTRYRGAIAAGIVQARGELARHDSVEKAGDGAPDSGKASQEALATIGQN